MDIKSRMILAQGLEGEVMLVDSTSAYARGGRMRLPPGAARALVMGGSRTATALAKTTNIVDRSFLYLNGACEPLRSLS